MVSAQHPHHHHPQSLLLRALPTTLPRVEVWKVQHAGAGGIDDDEDREEGLQPRDPRSLGDGRDSERFGYNDDAPWRQELSYTRWVQPLESELAKQVEYDMDDGDREWLDEYNRERVYEGNDALSYEFFEIVIDQLEKSWFELQKHIPKPASTLPAEDSTCAICDDGECEASNAIVFCDGCNLAVHQDCYGVPYIPEGQWLCRKCTVSPDRPVTCVLCPTDYGAFKQTTNGKWAHLLCAIWINETGVSNTVYMEPIDGVEAIPKGRWKLVCYLCKKRTGACIQCSKSSCYAAYHVTCAQEYGLHLKLGTTSGMTTADGSPGANVSYCHKHSPNYAQLNQSQIHGVDANANATEDDAEEAQAQSSRRGRPPKNRLLMQAGGRQRDRSETPGTPSAPTGPPVPLFRHNRAASNKSVAPAGPPIVPQYIYDKLWEYIRPLKCKQKPSAVRSVCRYWSLKRESRRGAPLLKRLHLEPWTASGGARGATDLEKEKKLELVFLLRNDLEKVRTLTELVRKREREKLRRTQLLKTIVEQVVFPQSAVFKQALQAIMQQDKNGLFTKAVDEAEVPDYYMHIKQPMWWGRIAEKIDANAYLTADEFELDVNLVLKNALSYNRPEDRHAKVAQKLQITLQPILRGLDALDDRSSDLHALHAAMPSLLDVDTVNGLSKIWYPAPTPEELRKAAAAQKAREEALAEAARLAALDPILSSTPARRSLPHGTPMNVDSVKQEDGTAAQGPAASGSRKRKRAGRDSESATPGPRPSTRKQPAALLPPLPPAVRASNQPTPNFEELEGEARDAAVLAAQKRERMLEAKRVAERERKRKRKEAEALAKERAQKVDKPQAAPIAPVASATPSVAGPAAIPPTASIPFPLLELPADDASAAAASVTAGPGTSALDEQHTEAEQASRQPPPLQVAPPSEHNSEIAQPAVAEHTAAQKPATSPVIAAQPLPSPAADTSENTKDVARSDVTNHDSFLLFNTGWVLPDGVRRRAKSAQIDGPASNTSLGSSGSSKSGVQTGSVGSGRSRKTSSPTMKTAPLPTVPLPTLGENGQSDIFAAPPVERVQTLRVQASDSDLSALEDSQSQPQPSTTLPSIAEVKPQEASASALPAAEPMETDEAEPDAPLAHPSSALSDISDLSDLSDPDEEAKEAVPSSRGATTSPRRIRSRRESTAASATPRSHYAPSRTRGMLAAEAALLRATPSREASTAPAASAEEPAVSAEALRPELQEDPVEPAPAPTPAPRRRPRASAAASTSATPIAGAGETSMTTATPARGVKAMDRLAELLPVLSYNAVKEIGDYELVWARKNSREAFWPAEVCIELDDEDREIPEELVANAPEGTLGRKMPKAWRAPPAKEREVLVQYFGHKRPWEIVKVGNLAKLRESQELDDLLRTSAAMPSKSKRSAHTIAKAYEEAVAIAEVPEDLVEENSKARKRKR